MLSQGLRETVLSSSPLFLWQVPCLHNVILARFAVSWRGSRHLPCLPWALKDIGAREDAHARGCKVRGLCSLVLSNGITPWSQLPFLLIQADADQTCPREGGGSEGGGGQGWAAVGSVGLGVSGGGLTVSLSDVQSPGAQAAAKRQ